MNLTKKLATAAAVGLTLATIAVATPAAAADGVLPPNKPCPQTLGEWTFYAGRYNDVADNLTLLVKLGRNCTYTAQTEMITAAGAADEVRHNAQVTITEGFVYPIVIL